MFSVQKFVYKEPFTSANCVFFVLMLSFFIAALYFFISNPVSNWKVSHCLVHAWSLQLWPTKFYFILSCPPPSLVLSTSHVGWCHSMIIMTCGTSCQRVDCSSPLWYGRVIIAMQHFVMIFYNVLNFYVNLIVYADSGWWNKEQTHWRNTGILIPDTHNNCWWL